MDVDVDLVAPCRPAELFVWVDDLGRYPQWLDLVPRTESAPSVAGDPGPAWLVDLRARLGPLARSKRLRMVRTAHRPPGASADGAETSGVARFERRELDGREHSPWVLEANVVPVVDGTSRLTMHLHYGGGMFGPLIEGLLHEEISRSRPRLLALLGG